MSAQALKVIDTPAFYRSLIVHGSILVFALLFHLFLFLKAKLSPSEQIDETKVTVLETAVRVDLVAMPRFTLKEIRAKELEALEEKTKELQTPKEVKKVADDTNAPSFLKEGKSFEELMEEMRKKKIEAPQETKEDRDKREREKKKQEELKKLLYAGNKLETGDAAEAKSLEEVNKSLGIYNKQLIEAIRPHWTLPPYLKNLDLTCRIRIYLKESGELLKLSVLSSSGNNDYDDRAKDAVLKAAPFAEVPNLLRKRLLDGHIVLGFPL